MATQKELTGQITKLGDTVTKIGNETAGLKEKVAALEAALENQPDASPELVAAVEAVSAQLKVVDDLVPDAEEIPTPENPEA